MRQRRFQEWKSQCSIIFQIKKIGGVPFLPVRHFLLTLRCPQHCKTYSPGLSQCLAPSQHSGSLSRTVSWGHTVPFNVKFKLPSAHTQHLHHPYGYIQEMCILDKGRRTLIAPIAYHERGEASGYLGKLLKPMTAQKCMENSFCDL